MILYGECSANTNRGRKSIYLFDGLSILGEISSEKTSSFLSHQVGIRSAEDNYDAVKMVDELYSEFLDRKERGNHLRLTPEALLPLLSTICNG